MRNEYATRNRRRRSATTCKKYDYELFRGIMSEELFWFAVSCNEYLEEQDRREAEVERRKELETVA